MRGIGDPARAVPADEPRGAPRNDDCIASPEDTIVAKLEWAAAGGSERQLSDVAAMLDIGGNSLDLAYVRRWVAELGLQEGWSRAQARRSTD